MKHATQKYNGKCNTKCNVSHNGKCNKKCNGKYNYKCNIKCNGKCNKIEIQDIMQNENDAFEKFLVCLFPKN